MGISHGVNAAKEGQGEDDEMEEEDSMGIKDEDIDQYLENE